LAAQAVPGAADVSRHLNTVSGSGDAVPAAYCPPLVSNGSLCLLVDYRGCQSQRSYVGMTPGIFWAGRRYGPPNDQLVPFGHFGQELSVDGQVYATPAGWTQTLNTRDGIVVCRGDYGDALTVETVVFTPLSCDTIVVRKRFSARDGGTHAVGMAFQYRFTPSGAENRAPRRTVGTAAWDAASSSLQFRYQVDGLRAYDGVISLLADVAVTAAIDRQEVSLAAAATVGPSTPVDMTFYLQFSDSMDGADYVERAAQMRSRLRQEGYEGLLESHRRDWSAYWDESTVSLPDPLLERVYCTAQYHLRANATRWSFPVGVFNTHWAGRYFGWDEMFCFQALASSRHHGISRRCPEFRHAVLPKALYRASHYGKPGTYGARYPWETLEDGSEAAPPGFWMEHVFHMSNIAQSAWMQYLYTDDLAYLQATGYPVIRECARFFLANLIYEAPDGGRFIGKCTDLERLGPARLNPFMTSCGAIYTLEAAARAAALLAEDPAEAAVWAHDAAKLRESLPHDGERYVPYAGCREESVAVLGGVFPYPLFDGSNALQRNAAYGFLSKGSASGNMYPVGSSLCAWYAGWLAAALAGLGDTTGPAKLLAQAAAGAGCFGELFEINEPKVSMRPWFATASGNVVYALNQMLLQSREGQILIAPAVPESWQDFAFELPAYGNLLATVRVASGRLVSVRLTPGGAGARVQRTLVIPARLAADVRFDPAAVMAVATQDGCCRVVVQIAGPLELIATVP